MSSDESELDESTKKTTYRIKRRNWRAAPLPAHPAKGSSRRSNRRSHLGDRIPRSWDSSLFLHLWLENARWHTKQVSLRARPPRRLITPNIFHQCSSLPVFDKPAALQFRHRLLQLFLSVHHDWPVPRHRFPKRLARNQQEAYSLGAGLHDDFVAAVEKDERAVARFFRRCCIQPAY